MKISDEELCAVFLQCGGNQAETARTLGISAPTVNKRLKNPKNKELIFQQRRKILEASLNKMISLNLEAVNTIEKLLRTAETDYIKMSVALKILSFSKDFLTIEDIIKRLDELEAKQQ